MYLKLTMLSKGVVFFYGETMAKEIMRTDILENWEKAKNFIPKDRELIFYSDIQRIKLGDGKTRLCDLDFVKQEINAEYCEEENLLSLKW